MVAKKKRTTKSPKKKTTKSPKKKTTKSPKKKTTKSTENQYEYTGHLYSFHSGWKSENLASYLLSRFSFISNPLKVGDDIGFDFFCTQYDHQDNYLIPKNSFHIQIKSNTDDIPVSKINPKNKNKVSSLYPFLKELNVPFYIGVVDKDLAKLVVYSGFVIPYFLALYGPDLPIHKKNIIEGDIELSPNDFDSYSKFKDLYSDEIKEKRYFKWIFPKICEFNTKMDQNQIKIQAIKLKEHCKIFSNNILTRHIKEFSFYFPNEKPKILVGNGTYQVFYRNFIRRSNEFIGCLIKIDEWLSHWKEDNPELFTDIKNFLNIYPNFLKHPIKYNHWEEENAEMISDFEDSKLDIEKGCKLLKNEKLKKNFEDQ